ncbi:MAG TPA: CinA family protein [Spirochaetales bacterium]|nr:CinA family protein [Spirochaetales bacterium]HPM72695.1 CinA family protein [Spirochaetales bacterium]HQO67034.1 CinA family protein [Spirochaetales bacterium]
MAEGAPIESASGALAAVMNAGRATLACAESCTGGLASAAISAIAGASSFFLGCVVSYSNEAKRGLLGVDEGILAAFGAVSEETALAMARGAAAAFGSDFAFSITGVAGPGGGSDEKPVGTVCFGYVSPAAASAERLFFHGDRSEIRTAAATHALRRIAEIADAYDRA